MLNITVLRDTLYNTSEQSGATPEYARGIMVGIVAALVADGMSFKDAFALANANLPSDPMNGIIPEGWLE